MVLWAMEQQGAGSLPCAIAEYRQYRRAFPAAGASLVVHVRRAVHAHAVADIDYLDSAGEVIARIRGYDAVADVGLLRAFGRSPQSG
jgi:hypothetical protein